MSCLRGDSVSGYVVDAKVQCTASGGGGKAGGGGGAGGVCAWSDNYYENYCDNNGTNCI